MRNIRFIITTVILLTLFSETRSPASTPGREPTCAVITFLALEGVSEGIAQMISERIISEFGRSHQYRMIERTQAENVLRENQIAMVSLDTSLAIEAGKILAAEYVVIGSIGKIGSVYSINSRLVSVESGTAIEMATTDHKGSEENLLLVAAVNNARQLLRLPLLDIPPEPELKSSESLVPNTPQPMVRQTAGPTLNSPPKMPRPRQGAPVELAWIPEGNLMLSARRTKSLRRLVPVSGFWMSKHEITQDQWEDLMGSNPSAFKGGSNPAENMEWYQAVEFCNKLENIINASQPDNETRLFKVRLPIDSEWEYACLAGASTAYHSGDTESDLQAIGWYSRNSQRRTHPVGMKKPNRWGLYDMHGNVSEWCDNFARSRSRRIIKGGAYSDRASRCTASFIDDLRPGSDSKTVGFRIIVTNR